ncbi:SGNH/GDSL hydrolase family protein [Butyrivibrio sp. AE3004]|uniref:SGNH/GDSL hydrolase family protein n=1 Tax=Butyrivibrio sp. AE3004 TaxID=1506994 RepID=UPI00049416A3|nr:SGNH/GDSL hydrolase family protein [Butyrivibrio sp. AE3004]
MYKRIVFLLCLISVLLSGCAKTEAATTEPYKNEYGRIFFIGDSRSVDMFDGDAEEIYDYHTEGIRVFAKDGCHCAYMTDVIGKYGTDEFDTLVSWLGCNDNNDAKLYESVYENLISQGKTIVICTVGPTVDENLSGDFNVGNYPNQKMMDFNSEITKWAASHNVKVIDLYTYVKNNIEVSPDGIHYNPKPTTAIWNYILSALAGEE